MMPKRDSDLGVWGGWLTRKERPSPVAHHRVGAPATAAGPRSPSGAGAADRNGRLSVKGEPSTPRDSRAAGERCSGAIRPPGGAAAPMPGFGVRAREAGRRPTPIQCFLRRGLGGGAGVSERGKDAVLWMPRPPPAPWCLSEGWVWGSGLGAERVKFVNVRPSKIGPVIPARFVDCPGEARGETASSWQGRSRLHTWIRLLSYAPAFNASWWVSGWGVCSVQIVRRVARLDKKRPPAGAVLSDSPGREARTPAGFEMSG